MKVEYMTIQVGNTMINSKDIIKYIAVMIYNRLIFEFHVESAIEKASKIQSMLDRMLPIIGGPKYQKRILLSRFLSSAHFSCICNMVESGESGRLAALKIISGYRTISGGAVYVLAGRKAQPLVSFEDYTS
uniref:Uncharacterized protein n=1 Tax=Megaselia scalaris TaxID=36166 RepID=T1GBW9_MEGSC